jgi:mono/diheme cytochrome c family protein
MTSCFQTFGSPWLTSFANAVTAQRVLFFLLPLLTLTASAPAAEVPAEVQAVLVKFCGDCHGAQSQEADLRLDALSSLEQAPLLNVLNKAESQLFFHMMPPADAPQPSTADRKLLLAWVQRELRAHNASGLDQKARSPEAGNWVDHRTLFDGTVKDKPYSPARRWLVSPQIFQQRVFDVFDLDPRARNANKHGLRGVSNPVSLPEHSGVRDYDLTSLKGGHLLTMLGNADWISKKQIRSARVKNSELKADEFDDKSDRFSPATPEAFETIILKKSPPTDAEIHAAITTQFDRVLRRPPTESEVGKYGELTSAAIQVAGNTEGLRQMLQAVLLESEFLYRLEFGDGPADEFGRRKLAPHEAAFAIAYALGDRGPDPMLTAAAREGRLASKDDYEREVKRMLADPTYNKGPIDPALSIEHYGEYYSSSHPKIIRFFREFFGYPMALRVFKDIQRSDGIYRVPDRGTNGTPGFLVVEADRVVAEILKADRDVFETLLTTDRFFMYHNLDNEKGEKLIDGWRKVYEALKDTDWRTDPEKVAADHQALLKQYVAPQGIKGRKSAGAHETDLVRLMNLFEDTFGRGGRPFTTFPWAHGNRLWHSPIYNLGRSPVEGSYGASGVFDYNPVQPFPVAHRKGILTHPAWLIAHSANTATDPVRRGKWIREKLLACSVPDVPITVDAKIPDDPHKTLGERLASVTGKQECWKCHQHMNPLGIPFEMYDDFGRFRTEESLEHPDNVVARSKIKYGGDIYKTAPFSTAGRITGSGDPAVDGEVKDALDMIGRLAKSERVRQSIIRHAFRFFMGRNETLSDSQTLIDADDAYVRSGGSFQAVIVSLLTSDSFIYRK